MAAFDKLAMISLYRNILKLHRRILPQVNTPVFSRQTKAEYFGTLFGFSSPLMSSTMCAF